MATKKAAAKKAAKKNAPVKKTGKGQKVETPGAGRPKIPEILSPDSQAWERGESVACATNEV